MVIFRLVSSVLLKLDIKGAVGAVTQVELHAPEGAASPTAPVTRDALEALAVIALSGAVGEASVFGDARGSGTGDLATLQALMDRASPRIPPAEQVDITRWGAVAAHSLLEENRAAYDAHADALAALHTAGLQEAYRHWMALLLHSEAPPAAVHAALAFVAGGTVSPPSPRHRSTVRVEPALAQLASAVCSSGWSCAHAPS